MLPMHPNVSLYQTVSFTSVYCLYFLLFFCCITGVSSFSDLISNKLHRVCLWIIGILTVVGNAMVLGGRGLAKTENRILSCFVKNLAAADMCIGIYLLCIGERDHSFRGQYNHHAHEWMISWQCTVIRILAVTTSEVLSCQALLQSGNCAVCFVFVRCLCCC